MSGRLTLQRLGPVVTLVGLLAACGEAPQSVGNKPRVDAKAWQGSAQASPYTASGWKAGDETSWQAQIRTRGQSQNEYQRAPAAAR